MTAIADLPIHRRPNVEYRCNTCGTTTVQAAGLEVRCTNSHHNNKGRYMRQAPLTQAALDSLAIQRAKTA